MTEHPAYQFTRLEKFTGNELRLLNQAREHLSAGELTQKLFKAVGEALLAYDVYDNQEVEISLLVKPVGEIGKPQYFRFSQPMVGVGRSVDNQVALKSPLVSKKHVQISRRGVEFFLKDLNSNNGTQLNGVKLTSGSEVPLRNEDVIKIDPFEIVVGLPQDIAKKPLQFAAGPVRVRTESLGPAFIYVYFQLQPSGQIAVLALEGQVARWMIQKIITGQRESPLAPWTEIETGLMEYLAGKLLATANPLMQGSRLVLLSVEQDETQFQDWLAKNQSAVELTYETATEIGTVYAFLCLPPAFLDSAPKTQANVSAYLERVPWLRKLRYHFSIDLGASFLAADQIGLLEAGDIILLDRAQIALENGKPGGKVELRSPQLQRGVIGCKLLCEEEIGKLTVETLYEEGLKSMTEASKKTDAPGAEGVVANIEIPLVVEFARMSFTLEEVSLMKEGQIVEIKKNQPEVVDLSVDGKIIANAKLVDVEGKLGVRIVKIVK